MIVTIRIPGKLTNPKNVQGLGLWKHRTLIRDARERAAHAMLAARGTGWPWPADLPKHIDFVAHLPRLLDDDSLPYALSPMRDALGDMGIIGKTPGTVRGPGRVKDAPEDGHQFTYAQVVDKDVSMTIITIAPLAARPERSEA